MSDLVELREAQVSRVFNIQTARGMGTAFLWFDERGSFFVTARHIVRGIQAGENIFLRGDRFVSMVVRENIEHPDYDVAIFTLDQFVVVGDPVLAPTQRRLGLGQRMAFLGFPHGLAGHHLNPRTNLAIPLTRTAFFSGTIGVDNLKLMILDGFNNPGFSGGPVFARNPDGTAALSGIISGYRHEKAEHSRVYRQTAGGTEKDYLPDTYADANSGLIYATGPTEMLNLTPQLQTRNPDFDLQIQNQATLEETRHSKTEGTA